MKPEDIDFFNEFGKLVKSVPDKVILSEGPADTDITVKELDEKSAKVYRYLKDSGIGKEDMVCILLPRTTAVLVCLMGVWKAGAAVVLLEEGYPEERIEYIKKDSGCALVIDRLTLNEIQQCEPLKGYEPIDPHAAAFAIYTSGTTGSPKGVLHEYGRIPLTFLSYRWEGKSISNDKDIFPIYFPLGFVPSIMITIVSWIVGMKLLVVPESITKDPRSLLEYFIRYKVTTAFFTPTFFRAIPSLGPDLRTVILSSESANDIWADSEKMRIFNGYCCSETANGIMVALLDKPDVNALIGRPQYDVKYSVIDEDGNDVDLGEAGELIIEAPYTRGYINLPEINKTSFTDGFYHSGDIVRCMDDGQYQFVGRKSDTIKINGKRVEPTEIEETIKRVFGLKWTAVKGLKDGTGEFLAAYHLGDTDIDIVKLREGLSSVLPYYMIPSYIIRIDEIPINKNGKMNRLALPKPAAKDYLTKYTAPINDIERMLVEAMQKVLDIDRIGIDDDFFLLGGDSLLAMRLLMEVNINGISINDIYKGRTCKAMAEIYGERKHTLGDDIKEENMKAAEKSFPLTAEQSYVMGYECFTPNTTMYNIPALVRIEGASAEDIVKALKKVISNHPSLLTMIFEEDGVIKQQYVPDAMPEICIEYISDNELEKEKDTLVQPFESMENSLLWRAKVFSAPSGNYLFFDVHHIIFDGVSYLIFANDLAKALSGDKLSTDYYYYLLSKAEEEKHDGLYSKAKEYFDSKYSGVNWNHNLHHDYETDENTASDMIVTLPYTDNDYKKVADLLGLSKNALFVTAGLLALANMNHSKQVMITWIYNGRRNAESANTAGLLFCTLPLAVSITDDMTLEDLIVDVRAQIENGIRYSSYPYMSTKYSAPVTDDSICILVQDDMRKMYVDGDYDFEKIDISTGDRASQTSLDVEIHNADEGTVLYLDYAASLYKRETIEKYADRLKGILSRIIDNMDSSNIKLIDGIL